MQPAVLPLSSFAVWWWYSGPSSAASTIISHRTSIASVLRHWKYDPKMDPNVKMLFWGIHLARPVQHKSMPQWNLHLVLLALLQPPFASTGDNLTDRNLNLKWWILKTCLLSSATVCRRSFLHAPSVAPAHVTFGSGDVDRQSTVSLLPEAGFLAKNQLPSQAPSWAKVLGIDHLNPNDSEQMLCPVRQVGGWPWPSRSNLITSVKIYPILSLSSMLELFLVVFQ